MTLRCRKARVVADDVVKIAKIAKIDNIGLVLFFFFVAFFFFLLTGGVSLAGRAASTSASERTRSSVAVKGAGAFWLAAAFAWSWATFLFAFSIAPRTAAAQTPPKESARPLRTIQTTQAVRSSQPLQSSQPAQPAQPARTEATARRFDPLRRDALGVQTRYPAVAKIVGRDAPQAREDGSQTIPLYYGTGTLVAEVGEWGIVLSNWHVVSEARDSIVVKFPTFSSPARVILRDEVWDLAALLVRKPPRVAPIPISQEVPGVGDALWVAGYGKSAGLTEFQIQGGRVQNYALLVTTDDESKEPSGAASGAASGAEGAANGPEKSNASLAQDGRFGQNKRGLANAASALTATPDDAFYYETLAVDKGVREGDSGGPIFNRYGELAGVLWGSNGESTMGTYCIRAQFFLTQAIGRLATLEATRRLERPDAPSDELLTWRSEEGVPDATGTDVWARTALEASGVHPISLRPAYVAADGRETPENLSRLDVDSALKRVRTALTVAENSTTTALPPSPPVFSPTFVSQQRLQNCVRPEVAEADFWTTLTDAELTKLIANRATASTQVRETSVIDESGTDVRLAYAPGKSGGAKSLAGSARSDETPENWARPAKSARPANDGANDPTFARWRPVGFDGENSENKRNGEDGGNSANGESRARDESSGSGEDGESGESAANVGEEQEAENGANREDAENRENGEDAVNKEDGEDGKTSEDNVGAEEGKEPGEAGEPQGKEGKEEKRVKFNGVYLNDFQVYLIVCMIFCLFYNAARLMTEADAKKERQKRQKARRVKEVD